MPRFFALFLILPAIALYEQSKTTGWPLICVYCLIVNLVAYSLYWYDKRQARKLNWRIPEKTLHLAELLGGWPAAYLAQQQFRHKTSKASYQRVFWCMVVLYQYLGFELISGWRIARTVISLF